MKLLFKRMLDGVACIAVAPAVVGFYLGSICVGRTAAFQGWSQCLSLIPGLCGSFLRRAFYRATLTECALNVHLGFGSTFSRMGAKVESGVYIGNFCSLGLVTIERGVLLASYVSVLSGARQHATGDGISPSEVPRDIRRVMIGANSWIGERAVIMADVGRDCIIGAGAVVTQSIPDNCVAVGVPARVVRRRQPERMDAECCAVG